ncbi:hypothetical protein [Bradyrhizobium sp. LB13.1]|jgi:hypothetical protein
MEVVVRGVEAEEVVTADLLEKCSCAKGCFLNFDRQSKRTIGETTTSPTSNSLPMPPAAPVVMTSVGCTSVMIWRQTSMFVRCLLHRGIRHAFDREGLARRRRRDRIETKISLNPFTVSQRRIVSAN